MQSSLPLDETGNSQSLAYLQSVVHLASIHPNINVINTQVHNFKFKNISNLDLLLYLKNEHIKIQILL